MRRRRSPKVSSNAGTKGSWSPRVRPRTRIGRGPRQAQPEPPARAWITAWLATALWGARFAKPLSTPTQPTRRSQKGDISTRPEKGTLLLCLDSTRTLLGGDRATFGSRDFAQARGVEQIGVNVF